MLAELRAATRSHHVALENALPLMRTDITRDLYTVTLRRFLGIYAPLEAAVARHNEALKTLGVDVSARTKRQLLEKDLIALGDSSDSVANFELADVPELHNVAAALGALYVLEGSTLGGQVISRHLRTTLGLTPEHGGAFFWAYGAQVGPMWRRFLEALELPQAPSDTRDIQDACDAAVGTFRSFLDFAVPKGVRP